MTSADCRSMTWLESAALSFGELQNIGTPEEVLLRGSSGSSSLGNSTKSKSDYVRRPISKGAWEDIFSWFRMDESASGYIMLEPHGGFMDSVPAAATPYPHRNGVLYIIQYLVSWQGADGLVGRLVRLHGALREHEPEGGVRELPGPGHRPERGGGRREHVRGRRGVGRALLRGQLPQARHGESGRGSHRLLQKRADHPALALEHASPDSREPTNSFVLTGTSSPSHLHKGIQIHMMGRIANIDP